MQLNTSFPGSGCQDSETPQSRHRSAHHPCWRWIEACKQHPDIYSGNSPKQIPRLSVWWLYFYGNYEARQKPKNQNNNGKTSILQIQSEVYWSTLTYSSENYTLGWSKYELIPAQVSLHGLWLLQGINWLWKELLKWKITIYIDKSATIFFQS